MRRAIAHFPAGMWPTARSTETVTLDYDARHRRRMLLVTDGGGEVLLDLERAVAMADGDGLRLDDGGWLMVAAAAEQVVEIWCASPLELARVAWHLGNRHVPTELHPASILIRPDGVLEDMVRALGAETSYEERPFQPEGGAYGRPATQDHRHDHDHPPGHDHRHENDHGHRHHPVAHDHEH
ncbi:MAG: urease accessory protein UreE [Alphaproteobacteria bacterium]|nr:urease accessory protein UreE [Alphaproteobacteria bacterium]